MKLNSQIEEYDVRSLSQIRDSISDIDKKIRYMLSCTDFLLQNIPAVEINFNSPTMQRAKSILAEYQAKFNEANDEITELLKSVIEFVEKLAYAWRSWN